MGTTLVMLQTGSATLNRLSHSQVDYHPVVHRLPETMNRLSHSQVDYHPLVYRLPETNRLSHTVFHYNPFFTKTILIILSGNFADFDFTSAIILISSVDVL